MALPWGGGQDSFTEEEGSTGFACRLAGRGMSPSCGPGGRQMAGAIEISWSMWGHGRGDGEAEPLLEVAGQMAPGVPGWSSGGCGSHRGFDASVMQAQSL